VALPAALVSTWILRRGLVLDWVTAGLAAGVLSGLAGLGMLELHCPYLNAIHAMVWHVAVVLISAMAGLAFGWIAESFFSGRKQ